MYHHILWFVFEPIASSAESGRGVEHFPIFILHTLSTCVNYLYVFLAIYAQLAPCLEWSDCLPAISPLFNSHFPIMIIFPPVIADCLVYNYEVTRCGQECVGQRFKIKLLLLEVAEELFFVLLNGKKKFENFIGAHPPESHLVLHQILQLVEL